MNKIGVPNHKCDFYIGNGDGSMPLGFDTARELVEEAIRCGLIDAKGKTIELPDGTKCNGRNQAYARVRENPAIYNQLYIDTVNSNFFEEPTEPSEDLAPSDEV